MTEYLVELASVTANPDSAALVGLGDRSDSRHLRSILIPGDESYVYLIEADSVEQVADAFKHVGLDANRIVETVGAESSTEATGQASGVMSERVVGLIAVGKNEGRKQHAFSSA